MEGLLEVKAGPSLTASLCECYWKETSAWVSQASDFLAFSVAEGSICRGKIKKWVKGGKIQETVRV